MSDLVSYLFATDGDMARLRQQDGHPAPYKPETTWFELGNEIDNTNYVSQALAMEKRAKSLGIGGVLKYACPFQCGPKIVKEGADALGPQAYLDLHTNDAPALGHLNKTIHSMDKDSKLRFSIWETNTGEVVRRAGREEHEAAFFFSFLFFPPHKSHDVSSPAVHCARRPP